MEEAEERTDSAGRETKKTFSEEERGKRNDLMESHSDPPDASYDLRIDSAARRTHESVYLLARSNTFVGFQRKFRR